MLESSIRPLSRDLEERASREAKKVFGAGDSQSSLSRPPSVDDSPLCHAIREL